MLPNDKTIAFEKAIYNLYGIDGESLRSTSRIDINVTLRCMYARMLVCEGETTLAAGAYIKRNHATVTYYRHVFAERISHDPKFRKMYSDVTDEMKRYCDTRAAKRDCVRDAACQYELSNTSATVCEAFKAGALWYKENLV